MSRRPSDKAQRSTAMKHGQQGIWEQIRARQEFTITDIWGQVDMHRKSIINYVQRLRAGGFVERCEDFDVSFLYRLVRDTGVHAPRLTKDGKRVTQGQGTQNMWRSMRMIGEFTPRDLAVHSTTETTNVAERTAKAFCTELFKAGYLRVIQKAKPNSSQAIYRLIRNTGPLSPEIQSVKQIFDPNLNEVTYAFGERK